MRLIGAQGNNSSQRINVLTSFQNQKTRQSNIQRAIEDAKTKSKDLAQPEQNHLPQLEQALKQTEAHISGFEAQLKSLSEFSIAKGVPNTINILYFAPNITNFSDPNSLTFGQAAGFLNSGGNIRNISGNFAQSLLTIQSLVSNYLISRSPESEFSESEAKNLQRKFANFRQLTNALLGMEISWTAGPAIFIGGTPLHEINPNFSQGQKWLLHFATSAYAEVSLEDPVVLCLDEPELHLHPAALNQILDILRKTLAGGQILIATHSIPLIAHIGYENTWFVSDGSIIYAGRNPELVINGLVGGSDGVRKLASLLAEPDNAAISRFAFESLLPPEVSAAKNSDPQAKQILRSLRAKREELGRPIKVLDYGAGKGRIIDIAIDEVGSELTSLLDYSAFEPSNDNAEICKAAIVRAYDSADGRYFSVKSSIPEAIAGRTFDVLILCNVMHEISPTEWQSEFSFVRTLLQDNGEVLVVEDLLLPHGEHAHTDGFVIASKEALRLLFGVNADDAAQIRNVRIAYSDTPDRLMCIGIPARFIGQISNKTVKDALTYINEHARRRIEEIRSSGDPSYRAGLQHALYLHQFANSTFALKRLA